MKLFLLTFVITAASAYPRWDETGAYRIIDDESIKIEEPKHENLIKTQPSLDPNYIYYRYYQALADPEYTAKNYQALADPIYARYYQSLGDPVYYRYYKDLEPYYYANLPAGAQYKAYQPFFYNFKLVKDIDA